MLNKIVCDKNLGVKLLINLQEPRTFNDTWENKIIISIDADDTSNQELDVNAGSTGSATYTIVPSQINNLLITDDLWNIGGSTILTLRKGSTNYGYITITFPDQIDSLGMLNRDENIVNEFTMTGSYNDTSDIVDRVDQLEENKQDKLTAGQGVTIDNDNTIKVTNPITYGTNDIGVGAQLATGTVYLVYEA